MKNAKGFSLVELLIVVAIIAIIAAIAVPSLLTSRQAANEAGGIQGCRTVGSAQVAFAATNNQNYTTLTSLVAGSFLDSRFTNANGFNGYTYAEDQSISGFGGAVTAPTGFGIMGAPVSGMARYSYGIAPDQVVRYQGKVSGDDPVGLSVGDGIGKR